MTSTSPRSSDEEPQSPTDLSSRSNTAGNEKGATPMGSGSFLFLDPAQKVLAGDRLLPGHLGVEGLGLSHGLPELNRREGGEEPADTPEEKPQE